MIFVTSNHIGLYLSGTKLVYIMLRKDFEVHTRTLEKQDEKLNKKLVNLLLNGIFSLFSGTLKIESTRIF